MDSFPEYLMKMYLVQFKIRRMDERGRWNTVFNRYSESNGHIRLVKAASMDNAIDKVKCFYGVFTDSTIEIFDIEVSEMIE